MSLLVIGLNHRTAPIDLRERLAFAPSRLPEMLQRLKGQLPASELVLLSTCNRSEVYLNTADVEGARKTLLAFLKSRLETPGVESHLYSHIDRAAVHHLFRVAAGLDSMVVGEHEVLGQVKQAYLAAHTGGYTGKLMNVLFQRSLYIGKRVRTETGLSLGSGSVGSVAVAMAERIFGDLRESRVMILGAGKMAELTAKYLLSQKVRSILVANRTFKRACELAREFGGQAMHMEEALKEMESIDIAICSTAAPHPIIQPDFVNDLMARRKGRSLFFIDIAVPRDVHPDVHKIDNVYLYNVDDLQSIVTENLTKRGQEVTLAEKIIQDKTGEFEAWLAAFNRGEEAPLHHAPLAQTRQP